MIGDLRMRIARALADHQQADLALDAHRYPPEKWLCCADAVLAALDETPRARRHVGAILEDLIEAQAQHLRHGGPEPDLSVLPPEEREHARACLRLVTALADRYPQLPPLEQDPVAIRLGLVDGPGGDPR